MKNTLMCLLTALALAVCLTACGGGGQTTGTADSAAAGNGTEGSVNGAETYREDTNNGAYDDGLMDGARDALDDAGRSVRNAVDDAGNAVDRAF